MKLTKYLTIIAIVVAALAPTSAHAQAPEGIKWLPLLVDFNPANAAVNYCAASPADSPWHKGVARIVTSGSSTTITALSSATAPFQQIFNGTAANYILRYNLNWVTAYSKVTAAASATSITVATAVDLGATGIPFDWALVNQCGTAASSGWFKVSGYREIDVTYQIDTLGSTSIDFQVQCRDEGPTASPVVVFPAAGGYQNYTAVNAVKVVVTARYEECRIGHKVNTDGTDKVTADVYLVH